MYNKIIYNYGNKCSTRYSKNILINKVKYLYI